MFNCSRDRSDLLSWNRSFRDLIPQKETRQEPRNRHQNVRVFIRIVVLCVLFYDSFQKSHQKLMQVFALRFLHRNIDQKNSSGVRKVTMTPEIISKIPLNILSETFPQSSLFPRNLHIDSSLDFSCIFSKISVSTSSKFELVFSTQNPPRSS